MGLLLRRGAGVPVKIRGVVAGAAVLLAALAMGGCASPGLPKPPSLQLPALVDDLSATRRGDAVELRFTLPYRTTDGSGLKSATMSAKVCRAVDSGACQPVARLAAQVFPTPATGTTRPAEMRDVLPGALASGGPHLLSYRVELANSKGRSGGPSKPAFAASGSAPAAVAGFAAQGSRLGTVLTWAGDGRQDERVVLRREEAQAAGAKLAKNDAAGNGAAGTQAGRTSAGQGMPGVPGARRGAKQPSADAGVVTLDAHADAASGSQDATLDTTALVDEPYRYSAERRREVQVGGKTLELRSAASATVLFALHDVFPPPAPEELNAAGFVTPAHDAVAEAFAVDLIWKPVDDAHLAGYNVYRQPLHAAGEAAGVDVKLNASVVAMPAFHDATAEAKGRYRYRVTAVDAKGNESPAAVTVLEPQ